MAVVLSHRDALRASSAARSFASRISEGHQATKFGMETGLYPILFREAVSVGRLGNHLLVGCSLGMCRLWGIIRL